MAACDTFPPISTCRSTAVSAPAPTANCSTSRRWGIEGDDEPQRHEAYEGGKNSSSPLIAQDLVLADVCEFLGKIWRRSRGWPEPPLPNSSNNPARDFVGLLQVRVRPLGFDHADAVGVLGQE